MKSRNTDIPMQDKLKKIKAEIDDKIKDENSIEEEIQNLFDEYLSL